MHMERGLFMSQYHMKVKIDELKLDTENKRGMSKRGFDTSRLEEDEHQLIILMFMVLHEYIDELISDMVNDRELTIDLLSADHVLLQESQIKGEYIVKEGNRRISSLKIIRNVELLNQALETASEKDILDDDDMIKYVKLKKRITTLLPASIPNFIEEIDAICYENTKEDTKRLNTILHRMHIEQKKAWDSIDKRFTDYKLVCQAINKGVPTIDTAIDQVLNNYYAFTAVEYGKLKTEFKEFFIKNHYVNNLIEKTEHDERLSEEQKYSIKKRLSNNYFLPIADRFKNMLKKNFGIIYTLSVVPENEEGTTEKCKGCKLSAKYEQLPGYLTISSINDFIYDIFIAIMNLDGNKPFPNHTFKTKVALKENYSDIYQKYVGEEKSEEHQEETDNAKKNPIIIYTDGSQNKEILTFDIKGASRLALNTLIQNGRDENGESIAKENIYTIVSVNNEICIEDKLNNIMIDVPSVNTEYYIKFYFDSAFKHPIAGLRIRYRESPIPSPFTSSEYHILDSSIVLKEEKMRNIPFSNELKDELKDFNYGKHKYISSYIYRGMWEQAVDALIHASSSSCNSVITTKASRKEQISDIHDQIQIIFGSSSKIRKLGEFYGMDQMKAKNVFLAPASCNYKDVYVDLNCAPHGSEHALSVENINNARKVTSKWLYIMNFMIHCCKKNIKYNDKLNDF